MHQRALTDLFICFIADGVVFVQSANGVILTEGIDGILPTKYFTKVIKIEDNSPIEW